MNLSTFSITRGIIDTGLLYTCNMQQFSQVKRKTIDQYCQILIRARLHVRLRNMYIGQKSCACHKNNSEKLPFQQFYPIYYTYFTKIGGWMKKISLIQILILQCNGKFQQTDNFYNRNILNVVTRLKHCNIQFNHFCNA